MQTETLTPILSKTRDLCSTIIEQPEFAELRGHVNAFLADPEAQELYRQMSEWSQELQQKQSNGTELTEAEVSDYEKKRESLFSHPVARGFMDAQEEIHKVQQSVTQYVTKTFELGRVPEMEDFDSGSCGPSCGCH